MESSPKGPNEPNRPNEPNEPNRQVPTHQEAPPMGEAVGELDGTVEDDTVEREEQDALRSSGREEHDEDADGDGGGGGGGGDGGD